MTTPSSTDDEHEASSTLSPTVCHLCRQRKTKCDRTLPSCGFCVKAKVKCEYVARPKKRGLRAGYVSELEGRIEFLERELGGLKRGRVVEGGLGMADGGGGEGQGGASSTGVGAFTPSSGSIQGNQNHGAGAMATSTPASVTHPSLTPSSWASSPAKRRRLDPESDAAIRDLMTLPHTYLYTLADLWFKENQPWTPILSETHIQSALENLPSPLDHIEDIELRALVSLEISYSTQAIVLGYRGRRRLSDYLRSQVLTEAMSNVRMSSLRALIIIAFLDYGNDNIPSTMSLLSVCRRTCEHLGLFRKLLSQIEAESPAQIGPPSAGSASGEVNMVAVAWGTLALDAVSTLGVPWRDVSAALVDHLSSVAYMSTPDLRDSYRTHVHLAAIGLQPVHTFIHDLEKQPFVQVDEEILAKCDEMYNNLMTYVQSQPSASYTLLADGVVDFDPNLYHTIILAAGTIIIFYQKLVDFETGTPQVAISRCLQACEDVVLNIRNISDADAELNTPLLANFFFVAARFKLVMYRLLGTPREASFDTIMHGINMCARRWPVARRLEIVLRAAIVAVDSGVSSSLPSEFWNLRLSQLDISERLKEWVTEYKPSLFIGFLNGPYI